MPAPTRGRPPRRQRRAQAGRRGQRGSFGCHLAAAGWRTRLGSLVRDGGQATRASGPRGRQCDHQDGAECCDGMPRTFHLLTVFILLAQANPAAHRGRIPLTCVPSDNSGALRRSVHQAATLTDQPCPRVQVMLGETGQNVAIFSGNRDSRTEPLKCRAPALMTRSRKRRTLAGGWPGCVSR